MTVRLTVERAAWEAHVAAVLAEPGVVPVVKGNGYGFGRRRLFAELGGRCPVACVGTTFELTEVPSHVTPIVLSPARVRPGRVDAVLTVGTVDDVGRAAAWTRSVDEWGGPPWSGRVHVKLGSSMRRYGASPGELPAVIAAVRDEGLGLEAYSVHLPLAGSDDDRRAEATAWLDALDAIDAIAPVDEAVERPALWVSHLGPAALAQVVERARLSGRVVRQRVGTRLWHGDKSMIRLSAEVVAVHEVVAGDQVGYRATPIDADGHLVVVGAGSAHGVAALDDGRSPFHWQRNRLAMVEPPHMHATLLLAPASMTAAEVVAAPQVGDRLDLQRPLIATTVDEVEWR